MKHQALISKLGNMNYSLGLGQKGGVFAQA